MGNGWGPTLLDNIMELEFIRQAQREFNDTRSYWISGTTNVAAREVFDLNSLINGDAGDQYLTYLLMLECEKKHCCLN